MKMLNLHHNGKLFLLNAESIVLVLSTSIDYRYLPVKNPDNVATLLKLPKEETLIRLRSYWGESGTATMHIDPVMYADETPEQIAKMLDAIDKGRQ